MRFVQGWDSTLLRMLRQAEQQAGHSRVVLSTYPPGYQVGQREERLFAWQPVWLLGDCLAGHVRMVMRQAGAASSMQSVHCQHAERAP